MKNIASLVVIFLITSTLLAEIKFEKGFGFCAGMTSGFGVSYRYENETYGFQATYGGGGSDSYATHSTGVQLIKPIHSVHKTRFNIVAGFGTFTIYEDAQFDYMEYFIGAGLEVEITFSGNMRFIIGSPFTMTLSNDDDNKLASFMPTASLMYFFE